MTLAGFLETVVGVLNEVGVPYMLTGSLAGAYNAVPRATQDVDLVVDATGPQVDQVVDRLLAHGLYVSREAARDDLIIAKLEWSAAGDSEVQREDVAGLLRAGGASLDRAYIERWVDELGFREEWTRVNARLSDNAADTG